MDEVSSMAKLEINIIIAERVLFLDSISKSIYFAALLYVAY